MKYIAYQDGRLIFQEVGTNKNSIAIALSNARGIINFSLDSRCGNYYVLVAFRDESQQLKNKLEDENNENDKQLNPH